MNQQEKELEAQNFAEQFRVNFYNRFGKKPLVLYSFNKDKKQILSLDKIESMANNALNAIFQEKFPQGIKTKSRKKEVVLGRACFYKLSLDMKYTYAKMGSHVGYNHATAMNGVRVLDDLLTSNDNLATEMYYRAKNYVIAELSESE